jgi:histidinol phosphatase-like PHP family hydrolase
MPRQVPCHGFGATVLPEEHSLDACPGFIFIELRVRYIRRRVVEMILKLIGWKLVTMIGHLDLIKMLLAPDEAERTPDVEAVVQDVLEAMRDANVAMDVKARGLLKPCKRIYPDEWILAEARRIGVPLRSETTPTRLPMSDGISMSP